MSEDDFARQCPRCKLSSLRKCGKANGYCLRCDDQTSYDYLKPRKAKQC